MTYEEVIRVVDPSDVGEDLLGLLGFEDELKDGIPVSEYRDNTENSSIDGLAEFLREEKNLKVDVVRLDGYVRL